MLRRDEEVASTEEGVALDQVQRWVASARWTVFWLEAQGERGYRRLKREEVGLRDVEQ